MTGDVTLKDKAAFRAAVARLAELNTALDGRIAATGDITAAVASAASKGVVTGGDSAGAGGGARVAAAYTGTVEALGGAVGHLSAQAKSASAGVAAAVFDLTSLVDGLTQIDDGGAHGVANV